MQILCLKTLFFLPFIWEGESRWFYYFQEEHYAKLGNSNYSEGKKWYQFCNSLFHLLHKKIIGGVQMHLFWKLSISRMKENTGKGSIQKYFKKRIFIPLTHSNLWLLFQIQAESGTAPAGVLSWKQQSTREEFRTFFDYVTGIHCRSLGITLPRKNIDFSFLILPYLFPIWSSYLPELPGTFGRQVIGPGECVNGSTKTQKRQLDASGSTL